MTGIKDRVAQGIVRHLLGAAGGFIAAKGWVDGETVQGVIGLIMTLVSIYFSAAAPEKGKAPAPVPVALPLDPAFQQQWDLPDDAPIQLPAVVTQPRRGFSLSDRSRKSMAGVDPLLVKVVETAIGLTSMDFGVTEGLRGAARQQQMIAQKKSFVTRSKHQDGLAIDVIAYPTPDGSWEPKDYYPINDAFQEAAARCGARLTWGGTWKMGDFVHFQLDGRIV